MVVEMKASAEIKVGVPAGAVGATARATWTALEAGLEGTEARLDHPEVKIFHSPESCIAITHRA